MLKKLIVSALVLCILCCLFGCISKSNKLDYNGYNEVTFENGDKYHGEWTDGVINGNGSFYFSNGDSYVGEYKDGKMHGKGVFTWVNGDVYNGEYKNDLMDGHGEFTWANGDKYIGNYSEDTRNGAGIMVITTAEGTERYEGNWVNDKKQGYGVLDYATGDKYEGSFVNGLPDTRQLDDNGKPLLSANGEYLHGAEAKYSYADGRTYTGYFVEGKCVIYEG